MEMVMSAPAGGLAGAGRVPGNRGMWVGILCELTEFALMFLAYAWFKQVHPADFHNGPAMLNTASGVWNTVVMLTSGYFAVRALFAIRRNDAAAARNWLMATLLGGIAFLLIKAWEFNWNIDHGVVGTGNSFVAMYYYLTFNHLVHATWGILGILWVLARLLFHGYTAEDYVGLEALASYWHATDIIWLVIFPFFYVLA